MFIYEFEFFTSEGFVIAVPFDFEGATQGVNMDEAVFMAADWLSITTNYMLEDGNPLPAPTYGNKPKHGGVVIAVAIQPNNDNLKKITSAEAARRLGVTPGRVSQMLKSGKLAGYKDGRTTWVMLDSVIAREKDNPGAGRPKQTHEAIQA